VELIRAGNQIVSVYPSPEPQPEGSGQTDQKRPIPGAIDRSTLAYIAEVASISRYWGSFLHLCASSAQARTILELGGCAGISGSYLASAPLCQRFVTVEGSPDLAKLAGRHINQVAAGQCEVRNALFDDALDALLPGFGTALDFAYIDGQHERAATIHYLKRITPALHPGSIVIFDDVMWSRDMESAWQEISATDGVSAAVLLGRLGVIVWGLAGDKADHYDLSRFTAEWKRGRLSAEQWREAKTHA